MKVVRITWAGKSAYMRDPQERGEFLRGVQCNEHGIALREGCSQDVELMVQRDRIESIEDVMPDGTRHLA